ncbi:hypothetical protein SAMN04488082_13020 [Desulfomicrobium apsheronum]|uniref:Uncharacterized protein n=1 Tax=Desulfomicrobium apsheronum TaxID=52560 RepID=A0A1I4A6U5_9BACT|nr:hypothetical protein [Desulfomicrobium apsheronum]SFK43456.1 hypothetical protein SAMN04488082_12427 [Desulfomicrobium apsheronum]SFK52132.1 hypothetical protein SAMN04488082_13020 [Desulfomicrobium apsheronum]
MGTAQVLNGIEKGKVCVETELVMVIGQLSWFANVLEDHDDNLSEALVLRGMIRQLEALVDPIAQMRLEVRS